MQFPNLYPRASFFAIINNLLLCIFSWQKRQAKSL